MVTREQDFERVRRVLREIGTRNPMAAADVEAALYALGRLERDTYRPGTTCRCEHCHGGKQIDEIQWSGNGGTYHLCKTCYLTTPAAVWDQMVFELARVDATPIYGAL